MWRDYQEEAAGFFRTMGFKAQVDARIEGARGRHNLDVWVVGQIHGVEFKWVVECKDWKTNVPKEKVLALVSVVQDVGADRGFLLSETGFQAGALRVASNTNITLTSIADLRDAAQDSLLQATAASLHWRLTRVKSRLWRLHKATGDYMSEHVRSMGQIMYIDMAVEDALQGAFPVIYSIDKDNNRLAATDWNDFAEKANALIAEAEGDADRGEREAAHHA